MDMVDAATEVPVSAHYMNADGAAQYLNVGATTQAMPSTGEMMLMASLNMSLRTRGRLP